MNERAEQWVHLGRISGVYGLKGWVRVYSYTEPRENILEYSPCFLKLDGKWIRRALQGGKRQGKGVIVHFSGCDTRDDAVALMDTEIAIPRDQLPELADNEFYWRDLIGLNVVTVEGVDLGQVTQLLPTGANDVLLVKGDRERCIPYIRPDVIRHISLEEKLIKVNWDPEF